MKFTALPVNVGDSFLLEVNKKVILVDGGMSKTHIVSLLKKKNIKSNHIDLLICTHYDADHINGIIGILKSEQFKFNEIWLPEVLGSLSYTFSKNTKEILLYGREHSKDIILPENSVKYDSKVIEDNEIDDSFELIDNFRLSNIVEYPFDHSYHLFRNYYFNDSMPINLLENLYNSLTLVNYSLSSGAYIRWFKFHNGLVNANYGNYIYSQNATQNKITEYDPKLFFEILYLTTINKESLVYLFNDGKNPNILFSADSDFSFLNGTEKISLKDNSIITVPHHGSASNSIAYSRILVNNQPLTDKSKVILVRSDRSQLKRPESTFCNLNVEKYCTICRNITSKQEVSLNYSKNAWKSISNKCICKK